MHWIKWTSSGVRALALFVLFLGSSPGQPPAPAQDLPTATGLKLRVDTNLVLIPVAVTDSLNRYVLGLQKEDFQLSEDSVKQNVAHCSGEDVPLSVGLVFDESDPPSLCPGRRKSIGRFMPNSVRPVRPPQHRPAYARCRACAFYKAASCASARDARRRRCVR